jgi:two-component system CheB/CheR fusion protein
MSRLIDDLLDVSHLARHAELRREQATCSEIVRAAVDDCRDELVAGASTARDDAAHRSAGRTRTARQVLSNVVGNAVRRTPSGGDDRACGERGLARHS